MSVLLFLVFAPLGALLFVLLLPLAGALICWAFGPRLKQRAGYLASFTVLASFIGTIVLADKDAALLSRPFLSAHLVTWVPGMVLGLSADSLSLLWTLIITGIGFLITVYSIGYMAGDQSQARFFGYMNFFVFAMLLLVLSDNFIGLLIGWGLVGLASYLLIGYYTERPAAVAAARKAFILNVVGDVGLLYGIFILFNALHSVSYGDVFAGVKNLAPSTLLLLCVCLLVAAAAKSAQVPLFTWLPDAMEGPTPVSALIHAATMVTAGVYLIARCAPLWNASPGAQELTGWIGAITLLLGAILGCVQWDIKRALAYSTMSQIGYMVMGVGVGAYTAGVLHFYTHAFFKALLFLTAGIIIHTLHNEQDMRRMGGLTRSMPFAYGCMLVGVIAITGVLPVGGYFSKDAILEGTLSHGHVAMYVAGIFGAGLTAFYMFRMFFLTFAGQNRWDVDPALMGAAELTQSEDEHDVHVSPRFMQLPVAILALGTLVCGFVAVRWPGMSQSAWTSLLGGLFPVVAPEREPIAANVSVLIVLAASVAGIVLAYLRYGAPNAPVRSVEGIAAEARGIPDILRRRFYFDDAIDVLFVRPAVWSGRLIRTYVDPKLLDGLVNDVGWLAGVLGLEVRSVQSGLVRSYAFVMVGAAVVALAFFAWIGTPR